MATSPVGQHHINHHAVSNDSNPSSRPATLDGLFGAGLGGNESLLRSAHNDPKSRPPLFESSYDQSWQSSQLPSFNPNAALYSNSLAGTSTPFSVPFSDHGGQFRQTHSPFQAGLGANGGSFQGGVSAYPNTSGTISPEALQQSPQLHGGPSGSSQSRTQPSPAHANSSRASFSHIQLHPSTDQAALSRVVPPHASPSGDFMVISADDLSRTIATQPYWKFAEVVPVRTPPRYATTKSHCPRYERRKSRNELRVMAGGDAKELAKIAKKPSKKKSSKIIVPKGTSAKSPTHVRTGSGLVELSDSGDTDSSDYDSDDDTSSDEEVEPSPLPKIRPEDPLPAVRYDTIDAVWAPRRSGPPDITRIRRGLGGYWEVVKTIRDRWKSDVAAWKDAEEKKKASEIPTLKSRVKSQRDMMEVALKAAVEHGHPEIIRLFGENTLFLRLLYSFLLDRVREEDYNGPLVIAIFEVLARCQTVSTDLLADVNLNKMMTRFSKRGNDAVKKMAKEITDNAEAFSKSKAASSQKEKVVESPSKDVKPKSEIKPGAKPEPRPGTKPIVKPTTAAPPTGIKRARASDVGASQPVKKIATGASAPVGTAATNASKTGAALVKRPLTGSTDKKPGSVTATARPRVNQVAPKPVNFFSALQSASKRPVASASQPKSGTSSTADQKHGASGAAAAAKPVSSFAQLMADLAKPKEQASVIKTDENGPPETEEERAKRLRKEERRKLRVSFKPMPEMEQVRYFTHDPDEEAGHDDSMVRDVGDVGGEGRALKQHMDQSDMDEDDEPPRQEDLGVWKPPTMVDFDALPVEERAKNYIRGGGDKRADSAERAIREQHEASTLMVVYTSREDIPSSPKEPTESDTSTSPPLPVQFGQPPDWVLARGSARSRSSSGHDPARAGASATIQTQQNQPNPQHGPPGRSGSGQMDGTSELERIFNSFSTSNTSTAPIPPQAPVPAAPTAPTAQPTDISAILAALQAPQQNNYPPPAQPNPPPQAATPDISSLLAALQANAAPAHSQPQPQSQPQPAYAYQGYQPGQDYQQGLSSSHQGYYQEPGQKRPREENGGYGSNHGSGFPGKKRKNKQYDANGKPIFVVTCRFWKEGKCAKGDACTYRHDLD